MEGLGWEGTGEGFKAGVWWSYSCAAILPKHSSTRPVLCNTILASASLKPSGPIIISYRESGRLYYIYEALSNQSSNIDSLPYTMRLQCLINALSYSLRFLLFFFLFCNFNYNLHRTLAVLFFGLISMIFCFFF